MSEPTIICPKCKSEIKLTESLAAPLIEATKTEYERKLAGKDAEVVAREDAVRDREAKLLKDRENINSQVAEKVQKERALIIAEESKKARDAVTQDLNTKSKQLAELQETLKRQDAKLTEAQNAQADLMRKERQLSDAKRELELTIEKRVQETISGAREQAKKEAEESLKLKVMEKEQTIASMQKQIEELRRRAEQGSQQLQGEVQELSLEGLLQAKFPHDKIEPVPKGEHGGDIVQRVLSPTGKFCGLILWESKRTKHWSDSWLTKLRGDQRAAKADIAVLVTQTMPKGSDTFDLIDNIWVTTPSMVVPIALALRHTVIEVSGSRLSAEGQQSKMEIMYRYLTGPQFRQRVQAIVEAFSAMQEDLNQERKVLIKQWSKREEQIRNVMEATMGMYGDMQGIAGTTLKEIDGLELKAISSSGKKSK